MGLSVLNGGIDEGGVLRLLGGSENERGVGGGLAEVLGGGFWRELVGNRTSCGLYLAIVAKSPESQTTV